MAQQLEDVYCTLLMSDSYLPGAAVLAHSLRDAGTKKKLAILITLDTLSAETITQLKSLYDYLIPVDRIRSPNPSNLYLMGRPDLSFAFTKIALWRQTQFRKIVYLDADVVALRALDELFDIEAPFAAAPDIGWPDAFNSGVMVITPDMGEYWALQTMAATGDSFDGADQGLLNQYFEHRPWQRLKFTYNCTPNAEYQWEPAYRYYKRDISAVHFIGKQKPWSPGHSGGSGVYGELLARWWAVHHRHASKQVAAAESISTSALPPQLDLQPSTNGSSASQTLREAADTTTEPPMTEAADRAEAIEQGIIDPLPTVEQRKFSAPLLEWDATRSEPPAKSKPEAANFPSAQYTFSDSKQLFKAPATYAEPPKDMWYKVPDTRPKTAEKPRAIFPWEQEPNRPQPTRVFAEDLPPSPKPAPAPALPSPTHAFSTVHYQHDSDVQRNTPGTTIPDSLPTAKRADEQWQTFQQNNTNAWDSVPGIENYVRTIVEARDGKRGRTANLEQATGTQDLGSPLLERRNRRESLIITDFPSAVERPSLPVTPAPIRRPSFWGEERAEVGVLPGAEGVPDQPLWNPEAKLDELRRSSLIEFEHLKNDNHPDPPLRALPEHSILGESASYPQRLGVDIFHGSEGPILSSNKAGATSSISKFGKSIHQAVSSNNSSTADPAGVASSFLRGDGLQTSTGLPHDTSLSHNEAWQKSPNATVQHSFSSTSHQSSVGPGASDVASERTAFKLPDFGQATSTGSDASREEILSPTQSGATKE